MAEVVAMRNNALPYPVYGVSFTIVVPLLDADGDPISPSSPDSERSLNGDTFADCTNEATEIATSSGVVYLTLTAAEMTADIVAVRIQSTGAKTTIVTLYPRKLPVLSTGTCQGSNDTGDIQLASGEPNVNDYYNGCLVVAVIDSTTEARIINDYVGSTKVAEIAPAWNTAQPDSNDTYTIYLPEGRQIPQADLVATGATAYTAGAIPAAVAGAAGGLFIAGSNAATTTASLTTGAIAATTITASGAVAFQSTFAVTGTTTLTGAVTASNASNNIVGIDVAKVSGDATAADNLELFFDGNGYNAANSTVGTVTALTGTVTLLDGSLSASKFQAGAITAAVIADGAIDTATFASGTTIPRCTLVDTLTTYTGNTPQTGDSYAIVNSGTFGNAAIKGFVDDIGTAGAGLTAIPWNAAWDAEVQSEVDDALIAQRLDELLNADSDIDGVQPPTVGSVFHELMTKTAGSFTFDQTTDSLEALRDRGDAAWITATGFSTHTAADVWAVATRVLTAGTNIQLPSNGLANVTAWTVAITGNITGNLSGSVGSVTTVSDKTGYSLASTGLNLVVPSEPSAVPTWGATTVVGWMGWLGALSRNKVTQTSSVQTLRNDADLASIATANVSDDATTFTRGEWS